MSDPETPRVRPTSEGFLGRWHIQAGTLRGGVLTACDRPLPAGELEESAVDEIPTNQRCNACQAVHAARTRASRGDGAA